MNTKNLKAYAPKARREFIEAIKSRAAYFGIYEDRIEAVRLEGSAAIIDGRAFSSRQGKQRKKLEEKVASQGYELFIREMAYTWFNRLAAIRYMELHDYLDHGLRVLSHPTNPDGQPEILHHAADVSDTLGLNKSMIVELQLAGDREEELYRELLLGQCHHLYRIMPFMFTRGSIHVPPEMCQQMHMNLAQVGGWERSLQECLRFPTNGGHREKVDNTTRKVLP